MSCTMNFRFPHHFQRDVIDLSDDDEGVNEIPLIQIDDEDDDVDLTEDDAYERILSPSELADQFAQLSTTSTPAGHNADFIATSPTGVRVHPGVDVELGGGQHDGDFLRVTAINRHQGTGHTSVTGIHLRRTRRVRNMLKKNRNELCVALQNELNVANPPIDSSLITVSLEDVFQTRSITFTNTDFPLFSFRLSGRVYTKGDEPLIEDTAELVCRWKYVEYVSRADCRVISTAIMQLEESDADKNKSVSDVAKKLEWLELEPKKSSSIKREPLAVPSSSSTIIDLTGDDSEEENEILETRTTSKRIRRDGVTEVRQRSTIDTFSTTHKQPSHGLRLFSSAAAASKYSFGDICAGAGGVTRGAHDTGDISVKFVVDNWDVACKTQRINFPRSKVMELSIYDFCERFGAEPWMRVDALHISFPCQPYAHCYTREGKNHDINIAAGYSVMPILERTKPRIVTFEQTSNFINKYGGQSFSALIHQLTTIGYNARWKIMKCSEYGNVQPRKRLFIIASCPGEPLPSFPKPTHGTGPFLRASTTIANRLALLPRNINAHMRQCTEKNQLAYNPNIPLSNCITTNGGFSDLHPSGKRSFNLQELALMAGFPPHHRFAPGSKTDTRRQIGNAVPSMVYGEIIKSCVASMRQADRVVEAYDPEDYKVVIE